MKIGRLWPASKRRSDRPTIVAVDSEMGLEAFGLESEPSTSSGKPTMIRASGSSSSVLQSRRLRTVLVIAVGLMAMTGGYWFRDRLSLGRPATGSITFETQPAGLEVFVSGRSVGRTPVTLALPPGPYDVRLGAGPATRAARVAVVSGTSVVQHYEMPPSPAPPSTTGSVRVQTEPAGLAVLLDGFDHGSSPASLEHVPAGDHEIAVRVGDALVKRAVHVVAGEATSVIITSAARAEPGLVAVGWLAVKCPVAVQIREAGHVIGASELDRMMMPSGEHDLEFVSDALVFRTTRRVKIAAGKVTATQIDVPDGKMNLNAQPWAEVFVDGERVGLTPIGNLSRAIGRHEVVFRHPDLGERRAFITVTTQETARLGVDLRKP
jgi:PEGA domain